MWSIRQNGSKWELVDSGGNVLSSHDEYHLALSAMVPLIEAQLAQGVDAAEGTGDGLLPEAWTSSTGIAFSEATGDGRDFTDCVWTSRDPATSVIPLMLQTSTDMGHFGAELAGFVETISVDGTPTAGGRFYAIPAGETFRDLLLGGRRFGVSVDPGSFELERECVEFDDDGWCVEELYRFLAYEIIGITGTPFPGFAQASIELGTTTATSADDTAAADDAAAAADAGDEDAQAQRRPAVVRASGAPVAPPLEWFTMPEPEVGSDLLVAQDDGGLAVPLTITDEGQVYGHVARWGQPHVGYPGQFVTPPEEAEYGGFNLNAVRCADGTEVPTGALVAGLDHAARHLLAAEARDHYAHTGLAWGDVHVSAGEFGPWAAGTLRPDVTELQLRVLRASSLSGDWREITEGEGIRLIAVQSVNVPGFGIRRRALAASGLGEHNVPRQQVVERDGRVVALVAAGIVRPCAECARRARLTAMGSEPGDAASGETLRLLRVLEQRTRHMIPDALSAAASRIKG